MYSSYIAPSGPCSTPPGVDEQARTDRLSVSHKESTASSTKLEYTDTGQLGPENSTRVYGRFYPDTSPVPPPPSNSAITGKTCPGNTRGAGADQERCNNQDYCLLDQFCLPEISDREERGGQRPVINLKALNQFVQVEHFKMEVLHLLPHLIQQEDWIIKLDLKDAYLQVQFISVSSNLPGKGSTTNFSAFPLACHQRQGCSQSS